jgi:general secretion pathway protein K
VLAMVAFVSMLALLATEGALMGIRRTQNQQELAQARWYILGAESFAAGRIKDLQRTDGAAQVDQSDWQGKPFTFPLDQGVMTLTLYDGANCFNLNSLITVDEGGAPGPNGAAQVQLARLLDLAQVRTESAAWLVASLTDWLDPDTRQSPGGAEDESYGGADAPYRAANTLLADVGELAHVRGFTPEAVSALAPFVCVRPGTAATSLNPNTLTPDQAVLLSVLIGPSLPPSAAEAVLRARPRGGWRSVEAFFSETTLGGLELNDATRAQFNLRSDYFVMMTSVQYRDTRETGLALIQTAGGQPRVTRRVFGADGKERLL